jgi:multicomponent Na+:H+ antiporter subunit E
MAIALVSTEPQRHAYQAKGWRALRFSAFYLKEVFVSTALIAWAIIRPIGNLRPAVIAVPLQPGASDAEVTAIANLITYTPGTLSIEVAPGNTHLYVHLFSSAVPEQEVTLIQNNYERKILELFR